MLSRPLSGSTLLASALLALLAPGWLTAQTAAPAPSIAPEEYAARRDSLAAHLGDGVVLAFGAAIMHAALRPQPNALASVSSRGHR